MSEKGMAWEEPLSTKDGYHHRPSLWSDHVFNAIKFTGAHLFFLEGLC